MKTWKIKDIEKKLGKEIKRNKVSIGFDVAEYNTGICILRTTKDTLYVDSFHKIELPKDRNLTINEKLENFLQRTLKFRKKIKQFDVGVIEQCHLQFFKQKKTGKKLPQVWVTIMLAYFGALTWVCFRKRINYLFWKQAYHARLAVGFKSRRKKKIEKTIKNRRGKKQTTKVQVMGWIEKNFGLKLKNDDLADGFVLALVGLLNEH